MPPLPSPGKVIKLQISGTVEGGEFTNIFHISYTGAAPTTAVLQEIDNNIVAGYSFIYSHNALALLTALNVKYTDLSSDTGAEYLATHAITATLTGVVLPINNAVCVSWPILRRYRGGHPRTYFSIGSGSTLAGSSSIDWQASFLANVQGDCTSFQGDVAAFNTSSAGTLALVNVSYRSGNAIRVTPLVDVLGTCIAKTRVCSQRRRLGKVGG